MPTAFKELHWSNDIPVRGYHLPLSLAEALELLERFQGRARIIAGGTDIIPELRRREIEVEALVDISRLPGLNGIRREGDEIILGALVTHAQTAASPLIREKARLLADGAAAVGSPQIRNVATVAGNLVSGRPAADTSIPLLALQASVTLASKAGERMVPLTDFFLSVGKTGTGRLPGNTHLHPLQGPWGPSGRQLSPFEQTQGPDASHAGGRGRGPSGPGAKVFYRDSRSAGSGGPNSLPGPGDRGPLEGWSANPGGHWGGGGGGDPGM